MKSIWQPNTKGLVIFISILILMVVPILALAPVKQTWVLEPSGSISQPTTEYPLTWHALALVLAIVAYPISMYLGRRRQSRSSEGQGSWSMALPLLCFPPMTFLLVLCSLVLYARRVLGRWPGPRDPDPKEIGIDLGYLVFGWGGLLIMCVVGYAYWSLKRGSSAPLKHTPLVIAVLIVSWVLFIFVIQQDPGQYLEWLAD